MTESAPSGAASTVDPAEIERYRARLSGPLADRIDLHVHVGTVDVATLGRGHGEEPSARVRERVIRARERQRARWARHVQPKPPAPPQASPAWRWR